MKSATLNGLLCIVLSVEVMSFGGNRTRIWPVFASRRFYQPSSRRQMLSPLLLALSSRYSVFLRLFPLDSFVRVVLLLQLAIIRYSQVSVISAPSSLVHHSIIAIFVHTSIFVPPLLPFSGRTFPKKRSFVSVPPALRGHLLLALFCERGVGNVSVEMYPAVGTG